MNILITGSKGQLGNEIQKASIAYPTINFIFTDVDELDITNINDLDNFVSINNIQLIVNCAAYTAVDKAEDDVELCFKINCEAVRNLGQVAVNHNIKILHISTDYVFDGKSYLPYTEDAAVNPTSVYGKSKLEGENILMKTCPESIIIRTSWLYSSFGNNFVKTLLRLGKERDEIKVIFDQVGTPTYAADLAQSILSIISFQSFIPGIYHFSNEGVCSWYDFTTFIFKNSGINCKVIPIETKDYPTRTPRPHYSVLNKAKIKEIYNLNIPHWETSLVECLKVLNS